MLRSLKKKKRLVPDEALFYFSKKLIFRLNAPI